LTAFSRIVRGSFRMCLLRLFFRAKGSSASLIGCNTAPLNKLVAGEGGVSLYEKENVEEE